MNVKKVFYIAAPILAWAATVLVIFFVSKNLYSKGLPKELQLPYEVAPPELPKIFVVQSGSMEPAVKLGSVVIVKPQESYSANDIVTFRAGGPLSEPVAGPEAFSPEGDSETVTHRIAMRRYPEGVTFQPTYITKGDANEEIDRGEVKNENVVGKVVLSVPYLGYGVDFAKKPYGFILLVIVPATIIVYEEIRSLLLQFWKAIKKIKIRKKERTPLPKSSILIPSIGAFLLFVGISGAYFFDIEESLGNILGAAESFPSVVINEVYYDVGPDKGAETTDEWVELYNKTGQPINLKNWTLTDNNTIRVISLSDVILPANGFALISKNTSTWSFWSEPASAVQIALGENIGGGLANDGDRLVIKNHLGVTMDKMSYGNDNTVWDPDAPDVAEGHSLEREPDGLDNDLNTDFIDQTTPTPGT